MLNIEKVQDILKNYPYIAAAYLFGSYASGRTTPMSDIDIAVVLKDNAPKGRELIHQMDYLAYRLEKRLQVKGVDLIALNRQGLIFVHNVLKTGRLIYDADPEFTIRFVTKVISDYCDFEPTIRFMKPTCRQVGTKGDENIIASRKRSNLKDKIPRSARNDRGGYFQVNNYYFEDYERRLAAL